MTPEEKIIHVKELGSAWAEATKTLRARYDREFHEILDGIYADKGIVVQKRSSHADAKQQRIQAAVALLKEEMERKNIIDISSLVNP